MLPKTQAFFSRVSTKPITILLLLIIIASIPLAVWMSQTSQENRQRASEIPVTPSVSFELSPASSSTSLSHNLTVSLILHAGSLNITGVDITVSSDNTYILATQFIPSSAFNNINTNLPNAATDTIHFVATSTDTSQVNAGDVTLGTFTLIPQAVGAGGLVTVHANQTTALGYKDSILAPDITGTYSVQAPSPTPSPTPAQVIITYPLSDAGLNLIGIPVTPTQQITAQDLKTRSGCVEVIRWSTQNQNWESSSNNNFTLEAGKGYFLRCVASGRTTYTISGTPYNTTPTLVHGWNLIALPYTTSYQQISQYLIPAEFPGYQVTNIKEVDIYEFGGLTSFLSGLTVNNFALSKNRGYFIKYVDPALNQTISALSLPPEPTSTSTPIPPSPTPIPIPGNIDDYPEIDIRDYNIWVSEFLNVLGTKKSDLNHDGIIDLLDFNMWRTAFQNTVVNPTTIPVTPTTISSPSPTIIPNWGVTVNSTSITTNITRPSTYVNPSIFYGSPIVITNNGTYGPIDWDIEVQPSNASLDGLEGGNSQSGTLQQGQSISKKLLVNAPNFFVAATFNGTLSIGLRRGTGGWYTPWNIPYTIYFSVR